MPKSIILLFIIVLNIFKHSTYNLIQLMPTEVDFITLNANLWIMYLPRGGRTPLLALTLVRIHTQSHNLWPFFNGHIFSGYFQNLHSPAILLSICGIGINCMVIYSDSIGSFRSCILFSSIVWSELYDVILVVVSVVDCRYGMVRSGLRSIYSN